LSLSNIKDSKGDGSSRSILVVSKGVLIAYIISILSLIIYGILLAITSLSEATMPTAVMVITMVSIALAGIYTAVKVETRGWLNGALVGLIYMIILFFISMILKTGITLDKYIIFRMFMGSVIGGLAGIIGINLK
jgi:putative membrane protein (TIGR04086 family)